MILQKVLNHLMETVKGVHVLLLTCSVLMWRCLFSNVMAQDGITIQPINIITLQSFVDILTYCT